VGATLLLNTPGAVGAAAPRILVTDAQERAVLATIRVLAAAGYEVTAAGTSRLAPGLWSRAPAARRLTPDPRVAVDPFLGRLEALVSERRYELLLAGTDASLLAISRHRDRLEEHVRVGLPPHAVVAGALDKRRVAVAATRAGLAPPEERVCADLGEALAAAGAFGYPVAVKPVHTVVVRDGVAHRRAAALARDPVELEASVDWSGPSIVQRWIAGSVISVGGVATAGGVLAHVVSRYLRTWPAAGGNVAFSETIAPAPGLIAAVGALVAGLEWEGLFELELIETGDGGHAAIDFNPRAYGSMTLAAAAGVDLSAVWCDTVLGRPPNGRAEASLGVCYRWEDADLRYIAAALHDRRPRRALRALRPRRRVTHAYFQLRDPLPALGRTLQIVGMTRDRAKDGPTLADAALSRGSGAPRRW
jgi:predicted ATP-grasp superfamily ATP-dependent carboligase